MSKRQAAKRLPVLQLDIRTRKDQEWRPKTRADCASVPRPCPYVGCRHHLGIDPQSDGDAHLVHGSVDVTALRWSCSLDMADAGPMSPEQVAHVMGVTRDQLREIEATALRNAKDCGVTWDDLEMPRAVEDHVEWLP